MNSQITSAEKVVNFTIRFDPLKVGNTRRHQAVVYANGKKVYTGVSSDRMKIRQEVNTLVRNLTLYGYSPDKPVEVHEEVWYLFRELKDSNKLSHSIRTAVLLQRHTWTDEQAITMLETLKDIKAQVA